MCLLKCSNVVELLFDYDQNSGRSINLELLDSIDNMYTYLLFLMIYACWIATYFNVVCFLLDISGSPNSNVVDLLILTSSIVRSCKLFTTY